MLARLIVITAVVAEASGFPYLAGNIPNGLFVPDPCGKDLWPGVGHMAKTGGGERNAFGKDFKAANFVWADVCRLDSDGDGMSNGEELGDPNCVWTNGTAPTSTTGLSHPGFCDPLEDVKCMNNPNKPRCDIQEFDCPAINDQEVRQKVLRFPKTKVPNKETNYYCMTFDLDQDQDYHMIATKPEIDNANVMHHMLLYGCTDEAGNISSPSSCGMSSRDCQEFIGVWSVGGVGDCLYNDAGFRIGKTGFKRVLLEMHWNNPEERSDYVDGSGMTIFYTSKLRIHDAGIFLTGESYLVIPPRRERVVFDSECPADCTRNMLNGTIYFTRGFNHMHYREGLKHTSDRGDVSVVYVYGLEGFKHYITNMKFPYFVYLYVGLKHMNDRGEVSVLYVCGFERRNLTIKIKARAFQRPDYGIVGMWYCVGIGFTQIHYRGISQRVRQSTGGVVTDLTNDPDFNYDTPKKYVNHPDTRRIVDPVINNCHGICTEECRDAIERTESHPCLTKENKEWAIRFIAEEEDDVAKKFVAAIDDCDWDWRTAAAACQTAVSSFIAAAVAVVYLFL